MVLLGRSRERCRETRELIARESGRAPDLLLCDLGRRREIDRAAQAWLAQGRPLHVLVNNAGLVNLRRRLTEDGLEQTFAVNYLAHFQLTARLLPRLRESAPARIVNVASDTHRIVSLDLDRDHRAARRRYSMMGAYGRSKLAIVCFTLELSRRLRGSGVTVNAVDPGPVESRIGQNHPGRAADLLTLVMRYGFPEGDWAARTAVWLAASPELEGQSGGYYKYGRRRAPRTDRDPDLGSRLWQLSAELTSTSPCT